MCIRDRSRPYTYGTTCELKAAGEIFPYEFQVFQCGILFATFGEALRGVKRIRFTGDFKKGHFDVLIPLGEPRNPDNIHLTNPDIVQQPSTTSEPTECGPNLSCIVTQPQICTPVSYTHLDVYKRQEQACPKF